MYSEGLFTIFTINLRFAPKPRFWGKSLGGSKESSRLGHRVGHSYALAHLARQNSTCAVLRKPCSSQFAHTCGSPELKAHNYIIEGDLKLCAEERSS